MHFQTLFTLQHLVKGAKTDLNYWYFIVLEYSQNIDIVISFHLIIAVAPCELRGCKYRVHSISWLEVVKGIPNQDVDFSVSYGIFSVSLLCFRCM